jgi:hypothetical protein
LDDRGQDKLPPRGPRPCNRGHQYYFLALREESSTHLLCHVHTRSALLKQLKPRQSTHREYPLHDQSAVEMYYGTVKKPTLTYLSMLLFPCLDNEAGNLTWKWVICNIPSKASHKSTNVQEVVCKFHTSDIDQYSTIFEMSYNYLVLFGSLQSSVVYSFTVYFSTFSNLDIISMPLSRSKEKATSPC